MRKPLFPAGAFLVLAAFGCGPAPTGGPHAKGFHDCPGLPHPPPRAAAQEAVATGPFSSHINAGWTPGTELIEVRYVPTNRSPALHQLLLYTDRAGSQHIIAGYPEEKTSLLLQFGRIVMKTGPFEPNAGEPYRADMDRRAARKILAKGEDLGSVWADMAAVAAVIERLGVDYNLLGPNSNSAAETVLKYAGYPPTDDPFIWDVAAGVDVILYAARRGNRVCDSPPTEVERL